MQWLIRLSNRQRLSMAKQIQVEVVYALADEQTLLNVNVPEGSTIKEVIEQSPLFEYYPELEKNINKLDVGIFGKLAKMDQPVRDKDRIEIYRPLIADPKEVRKKRAAEGKKLKKGGASA